MKTGCITCRQVNDLSYSFGRRLTPIGYVKSNAMRANRSVIDGISSLYHVPTVVAYFSHSTSTGRKCDGYSDVFRAKSANDASMTVATVPSGADRDELRYLQFFRTYSTTELSGFFGQDKWLNSVLIASEADPAINHAIIALGALHKKFTFGGDDTDADDPHDEDSRFALQQYNLSIKHLVQAAKTGPARLYSTLTTCIIFTCFACLQSRLSDALAHLRSGLKLLAEAEADAEANPSRSPIHPVSLATLKAMLVVLDNQARLQLSEEQLREWPAQPLSTVDDFGPFTTSITTMTEARDYVDRMFNRVMFLIQRVGIRASAEQILQIETELRLLKLQINIGNSAFDTFIRSQSATLPPREQGAIAMLRVHRILIDIFLHILPLWQTHGELVWDEVEAQMSQIVTFAAIVMDSKISLSPRRGGGRKGVSGFDFGVVQPLFMVAQKCRDPALRRRALKLMLQYPCRHGLWDSYLAGRVAWEYINLEETTTVALGHCSSVQSSLDVAAEARIDRVAIEYTGAKRGEIVFWTVGDIREGRDGVKRTVEWSWSAFFSFCRISRGLLRHRGLTRGANLLTKLQ